MVLVLAGLREAIVHAVPIVLKLAIGAGIGQFITLVGLRLGATAYLSGGGVKHSVFVVDGAGGGRASERR